MKKALLSILFLLAIFSSVMAEENEHLTREQAIEIAQQYLASLGEPTETYRASEGRFDPDRGWSFIFIQTESDRLGGDISVRVSPDGKRIELF